MFFCLLLLADVLLLTTTVCNAVFMRLEHVQIFPTLCILILSTKLKHSCFAVIKHTSTNYSSVFVIFQHMLAVHVSCHVMCLNICGTFGRPYFIL